MTRKTTKTLQEEAMTGPDGNEDDAIPGSTREDARTDDAVAAQSGGGLEIGVNGRTGDAVTGNEEE
jgi:hypothetical protein